MSGVPKVVISAKDIQLSDRERDAISTRCHALHEEFPETTHYEVTVSQEGGGHTASGHVTGKNTEVAGHGNGEKAVQAADRLLDALERQLRKVHDKRIFTQRREAQRKPPKKNA